MQILVLCQSPLFFWFRWSLWLAIVFNTWRNTGDFDTSSWMVVTPPELMELMLIFRKGDGDSCECLQRTFTVHSSSITVTTRRINNSRNSGWLKTALALVPICPPATALPNVIKDSLRWVLNSVGWLGDDTVICVKCTNGIFFNLVVIFCDLLSSPQQIWWWLVELVCIGTPLS